MGNDNRCRAPGCTKAQRRWSEYCSDTCKKEGKEERRSSELRRLQALSKQSESVEDIRQAIDSCRKLGVPSKDQVMKDAAARLEFARTRLKEKTVAFDHLSALVDRQQNQQQPPDFDELRAAIDRARELGVDENGWLMLKAKRMLGTSPREERPVVPVTKPALIEELVDVPLLTEAKADVGASNWLGLCGCNSCFS